jgi:Mg2+-importing ATPase
MIFSKYTNISVDQVFAVLNTSPAGLLEKEVALRQKKYGLNEVADRGVNVVTILLRQCKSPFFYLLLIAGVVSFFIGEKIDSTVIMIFISINVVLGFIQEFKAERTISLLKNIISQKVKVLRDNVQETIEKKYLIQGDMVLLRAGDIVPAELRITSVENFLVDESVLTGESVPVAKTSDALPKEEKEIFKSSNILFGGTSVLIGKAEGIVIGTGQDTALGAIITSAEQKRPQGIYEKNLIYFCRLILKIVVVTVIIIFLLNIILKGSANFFEFLLFCVALIVSILPEALPAIVILALSRGAAKMAKENVVVKRLSAIEDLGNIEILCTDKTGTLTQNILSLEKVVSLHKNTAILYGLLGSDIVSQKSNGANPFDQALLKRADNSVLQNLKKYKVIKELPFDSFRMRSSFLVEDNKGERLLVVRGAPEIMLRHCSTFIGSYKKNEIKEAVAKEGQDGKRVLLVAFKKIKTEHVSKEAEKGLTFLGYFVFEDPLKATAQEAIRLSKKLGVQIKIITGDSKEVAGFVSKETGLITNAGDVVVGEDLDLMGSDEFDNACEDYAVFARVSPDIKHKIIKSLQKKYEVGFLGEGINDVPALKTAHIGIAVSEATDIAKEASDVVLLRKDLRVIVNGIKDGRTIFANINKYIKCALANNFGNFYSIAAISLFVPFLPMLPVQILLGNLLSDFPLIAIATDSVDTQELRKPKMYQLHMMLPLIISLALVSTLFDFIFFTIFYRQAPGTIQTLWFIETILTEIFLIFIIRTRKVFWNAKKPGFWLLFFTIVDGIAIVALPFIPFGHTLFHFVTPPLLGLLVVFFLVGAYFAASEMVKLIYFHYFKVSTNTHS